MDGGGRVVPQQHVGRGLQRVLGAASPEGGVVDRGEGVELPGVSHQQVGGGDVGSDVVAGRVGLIRLVDHQDVDPAQVSAQERIRQLVHGGDDQRITRGHAPPAALRLGDARERGGL